MSSSRAKSSESKLIDWRNEDDINLLKSFIGSVIEFNERCGDSRRQRVVGTLDKCQQNSFHLINTSINGDYFGDYVINDYEVRRWRLKEFHTYTKPLRQTNRISLKRPEKTSKYLIPSQLSANTEAEDDGLQKNDELFLTTEVESIDLNEDDDPIEVNVKNLTQRASNDIIFVDEIKEDFDDIINAIIASNCVGFALFGDDISRMGSVNLMSFATPDAILVFDVSNKDIVTKLKPLLESLDIQKVMFALRHPSDALKHLFDIELRNAVDVRIWDYQLQRKHFISAQMSAKPELRSLEKILWRYLQIKVPNLFPNIDFRHFSVRVENLIRIQTIFLRELFALINFKLLEEVYLMNNRCIRSLRSAVGLEYMAVKGDEFELEIIENPVTEYEETERQIISLISHKPINKFIGKEVLIDSEDDIIIESDEELDEIVVRLQPE